MANGTMDATIVWGGIPHAAVENASRQMKLRFVSPDPAKLDTFRKNITNGDYYVFQKVPADTIKKAYSGRVEAAGPAYFWTFPFMMAVNNSMPEETAYEITKAFWENIKTINDTSPALSLISLETALDYVFDRWRPRRFGRCPGLCCNRHYYRRCHHSSAFRLAPGDRIFRRAFDCDHRNERIAYRLLQG